MQRGENVLWTIAAVSSGDGGNGGDDGGRHRHGCHCFPVCQHQRRLLPRRLPPRGECPSTFLPQASTGSRYSHTELVRHAGRGTLSVRASSGVTRRPVNPFDPRAPPAVKGTIVWHHQTRSFLCVVHHVLSITCRPLHRQHDAPPTGPASWGTSKRNYREAFPH